MRTYRMFSAMMSLFLLASCAQYANAQQTGNQPEVIRDVVFAEAPTTNGV